MDNNQKRTDKVMLIKGIKIMGLSLLCMFIGPSLFFLVESNNDKPLYLPLIIISILICITAVILVFKGLKTIMNSMFK